MTRRTTHPLALPPRDGSPNPQTEALVSDPVVGPQCEVCKKTKCAVCWAVETLMGKHGSSYGRRFGDTVLAPDAVYYHAIDLDWRELPEYGMRVSDPHHEPKRSLWGTDKDSVPLCVKHHKGLDTAGYMVRHNMTFEGFWGFYGFLRARPDGLTVLEALKVEMKRRATER